MGVTKANQENEGVVVETPGKKGIKGKSMIPVPKASISPKNDENVGNTSALAQVQKPRRPLSLVQNVDSPQVRKSTGKLGEKKSENSGTPAKAKSSSVVEKAVGTDQETENLSAGSQIHRNFPGTPHNSPSKSKARKSKILGSKDLKLKTDDKIKEKETIAYWKELAESRRQALDAALEENYKLHQRVEELEKENANLEEIVKEAEKLAVMVNSAAEEDELNLDESGIVDTNIGTAV